MKHSSAHDQARVMSWSSGVMIIFNVTFKAVRIACCGLDIVVLSHGFQPSCIACAFRGQHRELEPELEPDILVQGAIDAARNAQTLRSTLLTFQICGHLGHSPCPSDLVPPSDFVPRSRMASRVSIIWDYVLAGRRRRSI